MNNGPIGMNDLPEDMINEILGYLSISQGKDMTALLNLSNTCKTYFTLISNRNRAAIKAKYPKLQEGKDYKNPIEFLKNDPLYFFFQSFGV